jgi:hypothetical protein
VKKAGGRFPYQAFRNRISQRVKPLCRHLVSREWGVPDGNHFRYASSRDGCIVGAVFEIKK